jgi:hypothetical protein
MSEKQRVCKYCGDDPYMIILRNDCERDDRKLTVITVFVFLVGVVTGYFLTLAIGS